MDSLATTLCAEKNPKCKKFKNPPAVPCSFLGWRQNSPKHDANGEHRVARQLRPSWQTPVRHHRAARFFWCNFLLFLLLFLRSLEPSRRPRQVLARRRVLVLGHRCRRRVRHLPDVLRGLRPRRQVSRRRVPSRLGQVRARVPPAVRQRLAGVGEDDVPDLQEGVGVRGARGEACRGSSLATKTCALILTQVTLLQRPTTLCGRAMCCLRSPSRPNLPPQTVQHDARCAVHVPQATPAPRNPT